MSSIISPGFRGKRLSRRGFFILFFFLFIHGIYSQAKRDSLWKIWKNTKEADTTRLVAIGQLCSRYYWYSDPDSSIILADIQYKFAEQKKLKNYMGVALLKKSGGYSYKGDHHTSLAVAKEGLKIFREINHESGIANSLNNIGQDNMYLGNYDEAVKCFYEGLKYFEKTGNSKAQAQAFSNIGKAYDVSGRIDSAIRLNKYALALSEKIKEKSYIAFISGDLVDLHMELSKIEEAFLYCQKAMSIHKELNNKHGEAQCLYNMAKIHMKKKEYGPSLLCLQQSMAICKELEDDKGIAACYLTMGSLYKEKGNLKEAIAKTTLALETIKYKHIPELTEEIAFLLSELYEESGNPKKALAMYKLAISERDSNSTADVKNTLYQEQLKYSFEKKELLAKAASDKKLNDLVVETNQKDSRKNLWLTISIALLLLALLSSYFIYNSIRQKNIISDQKNNILKQQLLVSQMSPHFIFNSLNAVQNFIFKQDSYNAGVYLKQFSELIRMILNFSTKDLISLDEEFIFLENYLELQKLRFNNKLNYELRIDPELDQEMTMIPPMLAQPFIENAIEHGIFYKNGEGLLSIKISLDKNSVVYEIEDDGIGLNESLRIKKEIKTKHKSLAIKITKERIEAMNKQNHTDFEIEIKDKGVTQKDASGVYVKFAAPYFML